MMSQTPDEVVSFSPHRELQKKIAVTYLLGSLCYAGAERQALELMKRLDRRRFKPSLILMEDSGRHRLPDYIDDLEILNIAEAGVSRWVHRTPSLLRAVVRLQKRLRSWRSDILHAFLPGPSILGAFAGRIAHVPIVIGSRRSLPDFYRAGRGFVTKTVDSFAFRLADLTLANSKAVSAGMVAAGCPTRKCHTIFNGVDTLRFCADLPRTWRMEMGWSADDVVLGMIANFRPCKRHCDFIDAAALLLSQHPRIKFVMVGADHGNRAEIEEKIRALRLFDNVALVESHQCPERVFAALDIYICASDTEGFSNVLLEALACGKPVIATDVGGNPEIIVHGENGFLVPPRSPQAIATAANILIGDAAKRSLMGLRGRDLVKQRFSLERMVSEHEQLYESLVPA
ncbi:MAG TPA: glycosyltransferase [Terriglobales bacterium]|nr:glycosyltransferase [Terriglobales bacterium]